MILTNARILTFDSADRVLDSGSVEVLDDGAIGSVRGGRATDAHAVDLQGRLLMPALINCHTHLYSTLARGIHLPGPPPPDFPATLKMLWWRLDRALTEEDVYYSALIGLMDSARSGVGTVIDPRVGRGTALTPPDAEQFTTQSNVAGSFASSSGRVMSANKGCRRNSENGIMGGGGYNSS